MPLPELPKDIAAVATYKGIGVIAEDPTQDVSPMNLPTAAYHWWKAFLRDGSECYVVAAARLEEVPGSKQDGPGSAMDTMRYFIDGQLRRGATATSATPIFEWDPATQAIQVWSLNDAARLELDRAFRERAEHANSGAVSVDESFLLQVGAKLLQSWPDAAQRDLLAAHLTGGDSAPPELVQEFLQAVALVKTQDVILHATDHIKAARRKVVVTKPITLAEVSRQLSHSPAHQPRRAESTGQYL